MKIEFLQDYRGILSAERFFSAGAVIDLEDDVNEGIDGEGLIADERAKKVVVAKPKKVEVAPQPEPKKKKKDKKVKKDGK